MSRLQPSTRKLASPSRKLASPPRRPVVKPPAPPVSLGKSAKPPPKVEGGETSISRYLDRISSASAPSVPPRPSVQPQFRRLTIAEAALAESVDHPQRRYSLDDGEEEEAPTADKPSAADVDIDDFFDMADAFAPTSAVGGKPLQPMRLDGWPRESAHDVRPELLDDFLARSKPISLDSGMAAASLDEGDDPGPMANGTARNVAEEGWATYGCPPLPPARYGDFAMDTAVHRAPGGRLVAAFAPAGARPVETMTSLSSFHEGGGLPGRAYLREMHVKDATSNSSSAAESSERAESTERAHKAKEAWSRTRSWRGVLSMSVQASHRAEARMHVEEAPVPTGTHSSMLILGTPDLQDQWRNYVHEIRAEGLRSHLRKAGAVDALAGASSKSLLAYDRPQSELRSSRVRMAPQYD